MITTLNGTDTIHTINNLFRAHRKGVWWIGDFASYADAKRGLQISNSAWATKTQRGYYDGGVGIVAGMPNHGR